MYIYTKAIDGYPINAPLVMTPKEFEAMVLAEQMKGYFQDKIAVLSGNAENLIETQKTFFLRFTSIVNFFNPFLGVM